MASHRACSWTQALVEATRAGRDDVILWTACHVLPAKESFAVEVAAAYGRTVCIEKLLCAVRTEWSPRIVACALASGNIECVDLILADRRMPVALPSVYIAAITLPQYVGTLLARAGLPPHIDDASAVRWLAAQNLPLDGSSSTMVVHPRPRRGAPSHPDVDVHAWPPMRRLHAADLLPGGALAGYCQLTYWSTSIRTYICDLLDPLLVGDASHHARECIFRDALPWLPTKSLSRRRRPNCMGMRVNFTARAVIRPDNDELG
ncbi:hypothetical protein TW95_gp0488 [Pandoravirus inopinatum]|uniref:Uncharacterized protein n=1 Tax=Pandoravirus inopinatum TaxID=1605721 RepID=A0A0B5JCA7_9VIRU|nr:hypothetical protein TW95_gp0488 [Pandoravirus inopinatum]AJF97222.1 hypothetical protein [Pandoravirus inopinatum]